MTDTTMFVYVLSILGSVIDEEDDITIVTETENLAINIAVQKLGCVKSTLTRQYGKWCAKRAEEFPSLPPLSYFSWLESSIVNGDIAGVDITPKALVTYNNVNKIEF